MVFLFSPVLAEAKLVNDYPTKQAPLEVPFFSHEKGEVTLADYKGKVAIVHFWATCCVPCVKEMPELHAFQEKYKDLGVEVLALSQGL